MNLADILALFPIIVLASVAILLMLTIAIKRTHILAVTITVSGLFASLISIWLAMEQGLPRQITNLFQVDFFSLFFTALFCTTSIAVSLLSYGYLKNDIFKIDAMKKYFIPIEEFYLLLTLSTIGALILVHSKHFASLFLGLEVLSVPLLVMIAYSVNTRTSIEAGTKYLILTAFASAFLLFGMALIYAQSGTMEFPALAQLKIDEIEPNLYLIGGVILIITGVGFKLSLVPFHMWTPDVYQGAPTPISAYLATISKGAMFAVLLRYFFHSDSAQHAAIILTISIVAIASMLIGNLLALLQNNIKRILAYSSIAHLGYLLVALLASESLAIEAANYFLVAYIVTNLGAFGIIIILESEFTDYRTGNISEYQGLFWQHPWLAGAFTLMLLSLAGIPLTIGFIGKFYLFTAGVEHNLWALIVALVVGSALGLFYYLRIITVLFLQPSVDRKAITSKSNVSFASGVTLIVLTIVLLWLGIYPTLLMTAIQHTLVGII